MPESLSRVLKQARARLKAMKKRPAAAGPTPAPRGERYARHRAGAAARARESAAEGREIGPIPPVKDPARRARALADTLTFARTYFPNRFKLAFAGPHRLAAGRLQSCSKEGGRFALAMPRGTGKTTLAEVELLRAILAGERRFAVLIQAAEKLATRSLKRVQRELESNDRLAEDFPEVCHPIRKLERIHNRGKGQTCCGRATRIEWTAEGVTLPTVPGSAASGAIIHVAGLTSAIRGLSAAGPDGETLRPDLVIIDDAQTRDSARSPVQTAERESIILDDVLGLAGPDVEIAAVMLCTVIYPGDLSDRFLSPDKRPEWQGVRTRMLDAFPDRGDLWDEYAEVRRESFRSGDGGKRAAEFYRENREEMDRGARVTWPERKKKGELSGVQHAMNLWIDNPRGFRAEYQNDPEPEGGDGARKELVPDQVAARLSGLPRHQVPRECSRLTAFVDVGGGLLWYAVAAWDDGFGGSLVDYGCWPRQARSVFAADDPRPGLRERYEGAPEDAAVYRGLKDLANEVLGRAYFREVTGDELRVERLLVDCGWKPAVVYQFVRESPHAGLIYPSKGVGRTTTARGVSEWKPRPGERSGYHWRLTVSETGRGRMVQFDPDAWKTFAFDRLTSPEGGRGRLTLYGADAARHELIAAHAAAEGAEPVTIRGSTFDKWTILPHRPDNHLWDCVVGCAVAAGVQGLTWSPAAAAGDQEQARPRRKKVDVTELYAKARASR